MSRILVVDDDGHIREVVRFALSQGGFSVVEARDGAEALRTFSAASPPFDLVVLDIVMPEADGLEVCRAIRARGQTPIIFLSSRDDELDPRTECFNLRPLAHPAIDRRHAQREMPGIGADVFLDLDDEFARWSDDQSAHAAALFSIG